MKHKAELLIVTEPERPEVKFACYYMIEKGIHFESDSSGNVPKSLPANVKSYRAAIVDRSLCEKSKAIKAKLEASQTMYWMFSESDWRSVNLLERVIFEADLTLDNKSLFAQLEKRSDQEIFRASKELMRKDPVRGWNDPTAVLWRSLFRACAELKDRESLDILVKDIDFVMENYPNKFETIDEIAGLATLINLSRLKNRSGYLEMAKKGIDYMRKEYPRFKGAIVNRITTRNNLRSEAVYMICEPFIELGLALNDSRYIDCAADQILLSDKYLSDRKHGLWHLGDSAAGQTPGIWGRGMGWGYAGIANALEILPEAHEKYGAILNIFKKLSAALKKFQTKDGFWRNVVDDERSRIELSCTCQFVYGMIKGLRKGWLDKKDYQRNIEKGWQAIKRRVWKGYMGGCIATGVSKDYNYYFTRPHVGDQGTGPFSCHSVFPFQTVVEKMILERERK